MSTAVPPYIVGRLETLPRRLSDLVWHWAVRTPDATAIIDGDVSWSYDDLAAAVRHAIELLRELGVQPGDRVMLVNENGRAAIALLLAAAAIDAWAVIINARLSGAEIDAIAAHCEPRRILFTVAASEEAARHAERHRVREITDPFLGQIGIGARNEAAMPEPVHDAAAEQVAALIYTSGTTGAPKGAMLTHRNLGFIAGISGGMRGFIAEDVIYGVLPLSHAFGLASVFLGSLYAGACYQSRARFNAEETLKDIAAGMTALQGVPAMYAKLLAHVRKTGASLAGHRLRFISAGGAPLDMAIKQAVEDLIGLPLHNGYGMTEASPSMAMTRIEAPRRDGSVGQALPYVELAVVDGAGRPLARGQVGDVWCRGPGIMKGYYRAPELTAAAITPDGWLVTGDVGRFDEDDSLHILGRSKELIIRSGFNVYPPEVEAVLHAHPQVVQAAVIGAPGGDGNEEVVAYLQVAPDNPPSLEDLRTFCATRLAPYKRPTSYVLCEAFPAGSTGKTLKHRLAREAVPLTR